MARVERRVSGSAGATRQAVSLLVALLASCLFPSLAFPDGIATGSGFFVSAEGHFVTNYHVIEGADGLFLRTPSGELFPATAIRVDRANDLALLKAEGKFHALPVIDSRVAKRGMAIMTVGYPLVTIQGDEPKVSRGIINSLSGIDNDPRVFQVDLSIQPGNSGGPLVAENGGVIGIVTSRLSSLYTLKQTGELPQNVNYAIKSNDLLELLATVPGLPEKMIQKPRQNLAAFADLTAAVDKTTALVVAVSRQPSPPQLQAQRQPPETPRARVAPVETFELYGVTFAKRSPKVLVESIRDESLTTNLQVGDELVSCADDESHLISDLSDIGPCKRGITFYMFRTLRNGTKCYSAIKSR